MPIQPFSPVVIPPPPPPLIHYDMPLPKHFHYIYNGDYMDREVTFNVPVPVIGDILSLGQMNITDSVVVDQVDDQNNGVDYTVHLSKYVAPVVETPIVVPPVEVAPVDITDQPVVGMRKSAKKSSTKGITKKKIKAKNDKG